MSWRPSPVVVRPGRHPTHSDRRGRVLQAPAEGHGPASPQPDCPTPPVADRQGRRRPALAGQVGEEPRRGRPHLPRPRRRPRRLDHRSGYRRGVEPAAGVGFPRLRGRLRRQGGLPRPATQVHHGVGEGGGTTEGRDGTGPALDDHADDGLLRPRHLTGHGRRARQVDRPDRPAVSTTVSTNPRQRTRSIGDDRGNPYTDGTTHRHRLGNDKKPA